MDATHIRATKPLLRLPLALGSFLLLPVNLNPHSLLKATSNSNDAFSSKHRSTITYSFSSVYSTPAYMSIFMLKYIFVLLCL